MRRRDRPAMMRAQAFGLTWYLWRRHHWGFSIVFACGLVLSLIAQTIPSSEASLSNPSMIVFVSSHDLVSHLLIAFSQLLFLGLLVMAIFAHSEANVLSTSSGYPTHLWILPVQTWKLVAWPMLLGTTLVALFWVAIIEFVFRPRGISAPIWTAAMFASLLTCLQAAFWSSLPVRYLRPILYLVIWPATIAAGVLMEMWKVPEWKIAVAFLSVIPFAYFAAFTGLSRARRGSQEPWQWPALGFANRFSQTQKRFASVAQAQFWFERHRDGVLLPLCVFGALTLISLPFFWVRETARLEFSLSNATIGNIEGNVWLLPCQISLILPLLFGAIFGCGFRGAGGRQEDTSNNSFLATRPITFSQLAVAKIKTGALSSLAAWSILLFFVSIWLLLPGRDGDLTGPIGILLLNHLTPGVSRELLLNLALGVLWTWEMQAQGSLIRSMRGRWISLTVAGLYLLVIVFAILLFGHPGWYPVLLRILPPFAILAAGLKLLSVGFLSIALYRRKLAHLKNITAGVLIWISLAFCLFLLLCRMLPTSSAPNIAAAAVLLLPIVRFIAMPLALERSRHN